MIEINTKNLFTLKKENRNFLDSQSDDDIERILIVEQKSDDFGPVFDEITLLYSFLENVFNSRETCFCGLRPLFWHLERVDLSEENVILLINRFVSLGTNFEYISFKFFTFFKIIYNYILRKIFNLKKYIKNSEECILLGTIEKYRGKELTNYVLSFEMGFSEIGQERLNKILSRQN